METLLKDMHNMTLGEERDYGSRSLLRIPGGWIMFFEDGDNAVFIPYSDEFKL